MAHEESRRIVPGAKTAVLMMHGIAGTPNHFRTLLPLQDLFPADWSVHNMLMEGHGKQVEDFSRSSMTSWEKQTMAAFDALCRTHDQVIVIGHSMGTLFAIDMALARPEKVAFLLLIEVPLRVGVRLFGARNLVRYALGRLNLDDPIQEATSRVCSIPPTRKIWRYLGWVPRLMELIIKMHGTAKMLRDLTVPVFAYQSPKDELVSNRSKKLLLESGRAEVGDLKRSTHFYYHPDDVKIVQTALHNAIDQYIK